MAQNDEERPNLLFGWARALHLAYADRREEALGQARDALLEAGDMETAAEAESLLAQHFSLSQIWGNSLGRT